MGKFPDNATEALYQWSLNGFCDSSGDVEAPTGWYCRIDVDQDVRRQIIADPDIDFEDGFDDADIIGSWMLYQDSQGFVAAELFKNERARDRAWDKLERLYGKWAADD